MDREIDAGDAWEAEINEAMKSAHAAIFILDEPFLESNFCMDKEVGYFLQRHRDEGALILFVFADYCGWKAFEFIRKFQIVPGDDRPVVGFKPHSKAYTDVAEKIEKSLRKHRKEHGLPQCAAFTAPAIQAQFSTLSLTSLLTKLPSATTHLFGRDGELKLINDWCDRKGVFLWVADGGTGKSALIRKWLEMQEWHVGTRFLGHSFYSQGSHNQATSSRSFLIDALKQLNVQHEINTVDDELGRLLPEAAAQYATAAQLIRKDGYGRRYSELHLLHARLLHAQHDPAAVQALAEAEARIREVGQNFFWRELCAIAKEIGAPDPGKCPY